MQPILLDAPADVLAILDCCHASSAMTRAGAISVGTKETLAPRGPTSFASGVGNRSFTSALTTELSIEVGRLAGKVYILLEF